MCLFDIIKISKKRMHVSKNKNACIKKKNACIKKKNACIKKKECMYQKKECMYQKKECTVYVSFCQTRSGLFLFSVSLFFFWRANNNFFFQRHRRPSLWACFLRLNEKLVNESLNSYFITLPHPSPTFFRGYLLWYRGRVVYFERHTEFFLR